MKPNFKLLVLPHYLAVVTFLSPSAQVQAGVTLETNDVFTASGTANGNLSVAGDVSSWQGFDLGVSATNTTLSAFQLDFYNTGSLLKTASFDLTDPSAAFIWRDNLVGTVRNKMSLDAGNTLTLFNSGGSAGISLNPDNGKITLPAGNGTATGSGIYFGSNTTATLFASPSGAAIFPSPVTLQNGLTITSTTPATNSTTGSLTVAGGLGVGMDAYINGVRVGRGAGNVISNTVTGSNALNFNTTGSNNSAIGNNALRLNTTGYSNSATGAQALYFNTTGYNNSATGYLALYSNTTGFSNSATGVSALRLNTTGYNNSATGNQALYSNTTGFSNSASGVVALYSNTTGYSNSATGAQALYSNTTGYNNSAIGVNALYSNTTGFTNSATGVSALRYNTTGSNNSANGFQALDSNTTGGLNVALGAFAGRYHANGTSPLTDPESSIYIGAYSRGNDNEDNNSIVIGANAIGRGANTTVIGNTATTATYLSGETNLVSLNVSGNSVLTGSLSLGGSPVITQSGLADYGYQSAPQVDTAITSKGYLNAEQVDSAITSKNYLTSTSATSAGFMKQAEVDTLVSTLGYQTATQVDATLTSKDYVSHSTLSDDLAARNVVTASSLGTVLTGQTQVQLPTTIIQGDTTLRGKVIIEQPQGDISMGIYQ